MRPSLMWALKNLLTREVVKQVSPSLVGSVIWSLGNDVFGPHDLRLDGLGDGVFGYPDLQLAGLGDGVLGPYGLRLGDNFS